MRQAFIFLFGTFCVAFTARAQSKVDPLQVGKYADLWNEVAHAENQGKPKSAREFAGEIYLRAKSDGDQPHMVMALVSILRYNRPLIEADDSANFALLAREIEMADFPVKNVLQSIMATELKMRTSYQVSEGGDETPYTYKWSKNKKMLAIRESILSSLDSSMALQAIPIGDWEAAIHRKSGPTEMRTSLYDILAWRAIHILEVGLPLMECEMEYREGERPLMDAGAFSPSSKFAFHNFDSMLAPRSIGIAIQVFQELTRHHLDDADPLPLMHVELERLRFANTHVEGLNADSLYYTALTRMQVTYGAQDTSLQILDRMRRLVSHGESFWNALGRTDRNWAEELERICRMALAMQPKCKRAINFMSDVEKVMESNLRIDPLPALSPGKRIPLSIHYQNLSQVWLRVVRLPSYGAAILDHRWGSDGDKIIRHLLTMPSVKDSLLNLPARWDHTMGRYDLELNGLPSGNYCLLTSSSASFDPDVQHVAVEPLSVVSFHWWTRIGEGLNSELIVVDRESGKPIPQANLRVGRHIKGGTARNWTTDADGFLKVPLDPSFNRKFGFGSLTAGNESIHLRRTKFLEWTWRTAETVVDTSVLFFTDRSIYRPGQDLYFKCIAYRDSAGVASLLKDFGVPVWLKGYYRDTVFKEILKTSAKGSLSGTIRIPNSLQKGAYLIESPFSKCQIQIEDYRRPQFEVVLDPEQGTLADNGSIKVTGKALRYNGAAVTNGRVHFEAYRAPNYSHFLPHDWRSKNYSLKREGYRATGTSSTGPDGTFSIEIPRDSSIDLRNYKKGAVMQYSIVVKVTDASGESETATTSRSGTPRPDSLVILAPRQVNKQHPPLVQLGWRRGLNPASPTKVKYDIHRLLPDSLQPTSMWESEKAAVASGEITMLSIGTLPMDGMGGWPSGAYRITVSKVDGSGMGEFEFELFGESDALPPVPGNFWTMQGNTHVPAGDSAEFWVGTTAKKIWVLYEWEVGGAIVHREWLQIGRGVQRLSAHIPPSFKQKHATIHLTCQYQNQLYKKAIPIIITSRKSDLNLQFASFRDRMTPGAMEEWSIMIADANHASISAEVLACMYDASLEAIKPHDWPDLRASGRKIERAWNTGNTVHSTFQIQMKPFQRTWYWFAHEMVADFEELNLQGYDDPNGGWPYRGFHSTKPVFRPHLYWFNPKFWYRAIFKSRFKNLPPRRGTRTLYINDLGGDTDLQITDARESNVQFTMKSDSKNDIEMDVNLPKPRKDMPPTMGGADRDPIRRDLRETAFFFPDLQTDESGNVILKFKSPEALTRWRFMAFAHTEDMRIGYLEATAVTQKPIMIVPYPPRFLREGDTVTYKATVSNLSGADQTGEAKLTLRNELNGNDVNAAFGIGASGKTFFVKRGESTVVEWRLAIPAGLEAVTHRVTAETMEFSDGEESMVPILPRQSMVIQAQPIWIPSGQTVRVTIGAVHPSDKLSLELATDPLWEVILALPYMMEFPYECAEQTFSRYYANVLAAHILAQHPEQMAKLQAIRSLAKGGYLSKLEQHPELKTTLLAETPWLSGAREEKERIQNLALLTDPTRMAAERDSMADRLHRHEWNNTNFGWFGRMNRNPFLTQSVLTGFGRLDRLGASRWRNLKGRVPNLVRRLVRRLDIDFEADYQAWKKDTVRASLALQPIHIHALYARSYFPDVDFATGTKEAYRFYLEQAKDEWALFDPALQAMVAIVMHRRGEANAAMQILDGLREQAIRDPETGMHWKGAKIGWAKYLGPVQAQCLMIEAFHEVAKDAVAVAEMQQWLLGKKRLSNWGSTMATADACYALLLNHDDFRPGQAIPKVAFADGPAEQIKPLETTAATGRTSWNLSSTDFSQSRTVEITNTGSQPIWGAIYHLTAHPATDLVRLPSALHVKKTLWTVPDGKDPRPVPVSATSKLRIGQEVTVRIEFEADEDFSFVHIHDQRSSGFEPVKSFSECSFQSQVWHYRSTGDAATDFFMDWLPKGRYTFEYPLRVSHQGDFGGGVATIQCMYAPEFVGHSEGTRVRIQE